MLGWALIFIVVAIIARIFGFTGIATVATDFARILFFIFTGAVCGVADLWADSGTSAQAVSWGAGRIS